ncbi:uncharacterized protein KY384_001280 [Bacidia gigantensis]|uniref:uncharacterized protein n=1 Tax=Bacidia gigantensis TaxID=2732470 RepID=UPI001D0489B5|nr:uncharacterized protein KY384_001280 [Bacidia gigantensis]KAG8533540.1 hypothetical protein KY384_001280 [Bacidia gigantensis]
MGNLQLLSAFLLLSCSIFITQSAPTASTIPTKLIYQFPNGTWLENLAVRPDNSILTTVLTSPDLYLVQPSSSSPDPRLIHHFASHNALLGITELAPYDYQVVATNYSSSTSTTTPGSSAIYRVYFPPPHPDTHPYSSKASITLTTRLPSIGLPNGLATLNTHTILVADSIKGQVLAIDTTTGVSTLAISDPLFAPTTSTFQIGVNGIKVHSATCTLFFTNSQQKIFGRIPIDIETGKATGAASIIAKFPSEPTDPQLAAYDDFALDERGRWRI